MAELEETLNNMADDTEVQAETQTTETPTEENTQDTQDTQDTKPQTLADALNGTDTKEEIEELWKQSNQYKNGLWKSPDDVFKSVQFYEKKYQPLEQTIKRMGFNEPDQLEQAFKEYQEKLPIYQENEATLNQLNALLQDKVYGEKIRSAFDEVRRAQETEKFGMAFDDLPPVIKDRVLKGEQAFQELEEMKQEQAYNNALGTIQEQMAQIEQIAQESGLDLNAEEFLRYCRDHNISPSNMKGEFLNLHYFQMLEKAKQSASLATTAQNKQNKAKALNSSTKQAGQAPPQPIKDSYDLQNALLNLD